MTNMRRPICTSSGSASMSEVMRDTITPAFSRSKNGIDSRCRWSNTRMRRSRRKPSPTRLTIERSGRGTTKYAAIATHDVGDDRAVERAGVLPALMPWSMP